MVATIELFLALGFGPATIVADALVTAAVLAVAAVVIARSGRASGPAAASSDVVAEAEAAVHQALTTSPPDDRP